MYRYRKELKVPYEVVRDLIVMQNKHNEAQLALLGGHLKECARLFELALNPPVPPYDPNETIAEQVFANPRMSEEEEDLRHAYRMGDIDEAEFQRRLDFELSGSHIED